MVAMPTIRAAPMVVCLSSPEFALRVTDIDVHSHPQARIGSAIDIGRIRRDELDLEAMPYRGRTVINRGSVDSGS